jgi:hypothetical protein
MNFLMQLFFSPRSIKILLPSQGNMMKGCAPTNHIDQFKARLKEGSAYTLENSSLLMCRINTE